MGLGQKFVPQKIDVDLYRGIIPTDTCTFIKNLVYSFEDTSSAGEIKGASIGAYKPLQSTAKYINNFSLPAGYNDSIGNLRFQELKKIFCFVYNSLGNHTIYRLNCEDGTYDVVKTDPLLNFQLDPKYRIHEGSAVAEVVYITDPVTGLKRTRSFITFSDGWNPPRQLCVDDAIATNGFDAIQFPSLKGKYDLGVYINMGVASPSDCITINEVIRTAADKYLNNRLLFNTWQFRIKYVDVWGRPSEHGIISDMYIPGINDCLSSSNNLPRCLDLGFLAPNPTIDKIQVEYRNCIDDTWYLADTIYLFTGSPLGDWWNRVRNPKAGYDPISNTITYRFCADKECQPLPTSETGRVSNLVPRTAVGVEDIGGNIALSNIKVGFNPLKQELLDKITIQVNPATNIAVKTADITVYVAIWNEGYENFQGVMADPADKTGGKGYIWGDNNGKHGGAREYNQFFPNLNQKGFGGYLVGTGNYVIASQWYIDESGNWVEDSSLQGIGVAPRINKLQKVYQKFEFKNLPRGNYVFRLFSHTIDPAIVQNYSATSTTVWGRCPLTPSTQDIGVHERELAQEIEINTCNGDYDTFKSNKILVIADLGYETEEGSLLGHVSQKNKCTAGYIYETQKNGFLEYPVELIKVSGQNGFNCQITDHNGFYYYATRGDKRTYRFDFMYKCQQIYRNQGQDGEGVTYRNIIIDEININNSYPYDDYSGSTSDSSDSCNHELIKGRVLIPGLNIGVPNVVAVLSRGSTATTDSDGYFTIVAHDDVTAGNRTDVVTISSGTCAYTSPDGTCIPAQVITFPRCTTCTPRSITVLTFMVKFSGGKGLLSGGTYGAAIIGKDFLDRPTFAQDIGYFTIPTIVESKSIGPVTIQALIDSGAVFPPEITHFTIAITRETTIEAYIDWIVDSFQLVDNTGQENDAAPTQIKIYYASLNEFNKQNNFNTTTNWLFAEAPPGSNVAVPFLKDTVNFFMNGDGTFYDTVITKLVKYDVAGQYFLIDFSEDLRNLIPNALIRLVRPRQCTGIEEYFEVCSNIPVINGAPSVNIVKLNAFDTYYVFRQIPVPIFANPKITKSSVKTTTTKNDDGSTSVETITTDETQTQINEPRSFGFPFEHNSPSNFWGSGCYNQGRPFIKNPFEAELYQRDDIALSGSATDNGVLNFRNYFENDKIFNFDGNGLGGIVAVMSETSSVLIIGQNDYCLVGFDDNMTRVDDDGALSAGSIANTFGKPYRKIGSRYGCLLEDKMTISRYQSRVKFLDSNNGSIIESNFQSAQPFTDNSADSYIRPKIKAIQKWRLNNPAKYRMFHASTNAASNEYLLTDKIVQSGSFLNMLRNFDSSAEETVAFGLNSKYFRATYSFTPESYSYMEGEINDNQLFSFTNGIPHKHYDSSNKSYGTIYGVKVNRIMRVVMAVDNLTVKKGLSLGIYCKDSVYFSDFIITSAGQTSRIMIPHFRQANDQWFAPLLCDISKGKSVLEGEMLRGTWMEINLVGDPKFDDTYSELEGVIIFVNKESATGV